MTKFEDVLERVAELKRDEECETTLRILDKLFPEVEAKQGKKLSAEDVLSQFAKYIAITSIPGSPDILAISPELAEATGLDKIFWQSPTKTPEGWYGYHVTLGRLIHYLQRIESWAKENL